MALTEEQLAEAARVLKERAKARGKKRTVWVVRHAWHKERYICRIERHDISPTRKTVEVRNMLDANGVCFVGDTCTIGHKAFLTMEEAVSHARGMIHEQHEVQKRIVSNRKSDLERSEKSLDQFVASMPAMLADLEVEHTPTSKGAQ